MKIAPAEPINVGRRSQVDAAYQRIDFLDPADLLRAPKGVDDARIAARADHHGAAVAQPKTRGVLVPVLVALRLAGELLLGER